MFTLHKLYKFLRFTGSGIGSLSARARLLETTRRG